MSTASERAATVRVRGGRSFYFFGALGAVLYGYDTGIISGALLFLGPEWGLSSTEEGVITSCILVGAMIGALTGGPLADRIGRKGVALCCSVVFVIGSVGSALAPGVALLVLSRFVLGLAVGGASVFVPLYLAEMAPTRIRGTMTTMNQTLIILGVGIASTVNFLVRDEQAWRVSFAIGIVPAVLMLLGVLFMPETPRWLVRRGREADARKVLAVTRRPGEIDAEMAEIRDVEQRSGARVGLRAIWATPWMRNVLLLGIALAVAQQLTGINTTVYYGPKILTSIGFGEDFSLLFGVINTVPNLVAVLIAARVVDRVGRRPLLRYGTIGCGVGMFALGVPQALGASGMIGNAGAIGGLLVFTVSFSLTWGPVLWVLLSEIFPLSARGTAMGLAVIANWVFNFLVSLTLPVLVEAWGTGAVFLLYGLLCVGVLVFVQRYVSETKGRSLERIETDLREQT